MIKVLITGAAGNIGSALVQRLLRNDDYQVVGMDNLLSGSLAKLPSETESFAFVRADVNNLAELAPVMRKEKFDFVFHYAAVVGVQRTLQNPMLVLNDIQGFRNILDLARETHVRRVFYSSSSEVYGEPVEFPQNEMTTPLNSRLPYAVVKNVGECFLRSYQKEHGVPFTIFRFFNTYGPRQSEDFVISRFLRQALNGQDITIYGDGLQTRTFCYIDDNVETVMACLEKDLMVNEIMNVGSDEEITIKSLAQQILSVTGSKSRLVHLAPLREGDMTRRKPDNSRMRDILGRPLTSLEEGLRRTMNDPQFKSGLALSLNKG